MTKPPVVSIIVPVHDLELYVERCLDSLSGQTLRALEILVIDDGSTDASPEVLAELAAKDPRVRVERQAHAGRGAALNRGLELARGEYVMIVDGADFLEPDAAETLEALARSSGAELVLGNVRQRLAGGSGEILKPVAGPSRVLSETERGSLLSASSTTGARLYARRLFFEEGLRFTDRPRFDEINFAPRAYLAATPIAYVDRTLHQIEVQAPGEPAPNVSEVVDALDAVLEHFHARGHFDAWHAELLRFTLRRVLDALPVVRSLPPTSHLGALQQLFRLLDGRFGDAWTGAPLRRAAGRRTALWIGQARRLGYLPIAWTWVVQGASAQTGQATRDRGGPVLVQYRLLRKRLKRKALSNFPRWAQ